MLVTWCVLWTRKNCSSTSTHSVIRFDLIIDQHHFEYSFRWAHFHLSSPFQVPFLFLAGNKLPPDSIKLFRIIPFQEFRSASGYHYVISELYHRTFTSCVLCCGLGTERLGCSHVRKKTTPYTGIAKWQPTFRPSNCIEEKHHQSLQCIPLSTSTNTQPKLELNNSRVPLIAPEIIGVNTKHD